MDLILFFSAGDLTLIFTALLALLVEGESNNSKVPGEQQSQLTNYQRWFIGLSVKECEWFMRSQLSHYGYSPIQTVPQLQSLLLRTVFPKWLFGAHLSCLVPIPHLIYVLLDRTSR